MDDSDKTSIEQNVVNFKLYISYINFDTWLYSKIWFKFELNLLTKV